MQLKTRPLISVIIPTHNRARILPEALASVLGQEGTGREFDMQVIVVDDASSDETPDIMRGYPDIQYVRLDANRGVSAARNAGIRASSGAYLAFLDDDDVWLPQKLRLQVPVMEDHPEAGVVYSQIVFRSEGNESLKPQIDQAISGMLFREVLMGSFFPYIPRFLIRREAVQKAGMFDESFRYHEDYEFTARLAFHAPFVFVPGAVCIYRFNMQESKWISALLKGTEQPFRKIEAVLTLLPDSEESASLKLEARARANLGLADDLALVGEFDRMRKHMRAGLQMLPRLLNDESASETITTMARRLSGASQTPIAAVRALCADLCDAIGKPAIRTEPGLSRLLGEIWQAVAVQLSAAGRHRRASYAAICAMLYNRQNVNSGLLGLAARGVVGTRVYVVLAFAKHIVCGEL